MRLISKNCSNTGGFVKLTDSDEESEFVTVSIFEMRNLLSMVEEMGFTAVRLSSLTPKEIVKEDGTMGQNDRDLKVLISRPATINGVMDSPYALCQFIINDSD